MPSFYTMFLYVYSRSFVPKNINLIKEIFFNFQLELEVNTIETKLGIITINFKFLIDYFQEESNDKT